MSEAEPIDGGDLPDGTSRRAWSLKVYIIGLVAVVVVAAAGNVVYQRWAATDDARQAAHADARFAATVAADQLTGGLDLIRTTVATTAATPGLEAVLAGPTPCQLTFGQSGLVSSGHIDVIGADGKIGCTSAEKESAAVYADASWLGDAMNGPVVRGPIVDVRTGAQVLLVSAPFGGKGAVAAFVDLATLGTQLSRELGGPRGLEFVVVDTAADVVLARSVDPDAWTARSTAGTPFDIAEGSAPDHDLDGLSRLYGSAVVDGQPWSVFAGADESAALAAANRIGDRQLAITAAGLLVLLAAAFVLYRRVARPITKLSSAVQAAAARDSSGPIAVSGPAEISTLVDDFNRLIEVANNELRASARLAAMVESSADAIIGKTLDGKVTSWNGAATSLFGYTADEIVGHNVAQIVPMERADEELSILRRIANGEPVEQLETTRIRKDGSVVEVSMTVSPIRDAAGTVVGLSTVSRDITERNRVEAERRTLADRLGQSERLESVGQLAGGIAHDFNNLLAVIMNYASFVSSQTEDRPAVQADVEQIQFAAERAARLTRQLLTFARRDTIRTETLDLNAIVADVHNLLSRTIGEDIALVVDLGDATQLIEGDRGQVEQVLLNLAVNARDAMPDGGTLTIETSAVDLDDGYAQLHPDAAPGRYVQLAVSDTGTGMTPEVASRIFEPFFTTKAAGKGTGLGLATVYGIVTKNGGTMSVYSEPGLGTTFRLYFPASAAMATESVTPAAAYPHGNGETILVVEDEPAVLELTSRILRHDGYNVLEAATFEDALSLAASTEFQLLLTDSVMPSMSGRMLAQQLSEMSPGHAVLFMSGYSSGVVMPQGVLDQGAILVQKPFDRRTLLTSVQAALAAPRTDSSTLV